MSSVGECPICGGDWDDGNRDQPAYNNCVCEEGADGPEPDEAEVRAERIFRELWGSEL